MVVGRSAHRGCRCSRGRSHRRLKRRAPDKWRRFLSRLVLRHFERLRLKFSLSARKLCSRVSTLRTVRTLCAGIDFAASGPRRHAGGSSSEDRPRRPVQVRTEIRAAVKARIGRDALLGRRGALQLSRRSASALLRRTQKLQKLHTVGTPQAGTGVPALCGVVADVSISNLVVSNGDIA
jgi:hypothetical protein